MYNRTQFKNVNKFFSKHFIRNISINDHKPSATYQYNSIILINIRLLVALHETLQYLIHMGSSKKFHVNFILAQISNQISIEFYNLQGQKQEVWQRLFTDDCCVRFWQIPHCTMLNYMIFLLIFHHIIGIQRGNNQKNKNTSSDEYICILLTFEQESSEMKFCKNISGRVKIIQKGQKGSIT